MRMKTEDDKRLAQLRQNLKMMSLVEQIPKSQLTELVSDMKTIGIAYAAGADYRLVVRRLRQKYLGRRRKLFDGLIQHRQFETLLDTFVEDQTTSGQPPCDGSLERGTESTEAA